MEINEKKVSLMLSFLIGGLIGGSITFLLASSSMRKRSTMPAGKTREWSLPDDMEGQSYEEGGYCAPEGADVHYDMGKDTYYSNDV